jgi:hypothetical protein
MWCLPAIFGGEQNVHKNAVNFCKSFSDGKLKSNDFRKLEDGEV